MIDEKILFAGYRTWAIDAFEKIKIRTNNKLDLHLVTTRKKLQEYLQNNDKVFLILVGWSWILPKKVVDNNYVLCLHPSDLPAYSGGSPIQHQILDGLTHTKMTLFKVNSVLDSGAIIDKENLEISKGMSQIFENMSQASVELIVRFINNYPKISLIPQKRNKSHRKRLKPEDSKLTDRDFSRMNTRQLYNFIRCREDPYPNVFIEDDHGKLLFKIVEFIEK